MPILIDAADTSEKLVVFWKLENILSLYVHAVVNTKLTNENKCELTNIYADFFFLNCYYVKMLN